MSKRMVTYQVGDDKIVSIDGHDVGTGGVGDKSISRRMITYKVDDAGKITSIDGHELNGGGGGDYEIKALEVTQNGVYDVGGEAYKPVRVNVPQTAQSGTLKAVLDATKSASYLFEEYKGISVAELINPTDTSNVTKTDHMFENCRKLTTIPELDTYNVTSMQYMFKYCIGLTSIPILNTSKVTNMYGMFINCINLISIPQLDVSNVDNFTNAFTACIKLEEIHMRGIKASFDISSSTLFTKEALLEIINNLATVTSTKTLKMGSTNLAKLTDEEKAIATNKGWQLA